MMRKQLYQGVGVLFVLTVMGIATLAHASADAQGDFNLQVTPSPIVTTVKPGEKTQVTLKIRNAGSSSEQLKIEPRAFAFNSSTGSVAFDSNKLPAVVTWMSFSQQYFTVLPGQWFSEDITFNVPKDAGFSYSFALVVSRQKPTKPTNGTQAVEGSLAVFTLLNVDKPGAVNKLQAVTFQSSKKLYEYLPATFEVRFKNTGNTIVQPYGNIFIQRSSKAQKSLAVLSVNEKQAYVLPGTERTITASWNDGFATLQLTSDPDGSVKQKLSLDWTKLSHFRIGRYSARLVAVYSDGQHDVPIEGMVTFWVIPWRAIGGFIVGLVLLWALVRWRNKRRTQKAVRRAIAAHDAAQKTKNEPQEKAKDV